MDDPILSGFAAQQAEEQELDTLLEKGMRFEVNKRSILRFIGRPTRRFLLKQPFLGCLDHLSAVYIKMNYDLDALRLDSTGEANRLVNQHVHRAARVVAIAWLNSHWGILLFAGLMSWYFRWHLTPKTLLELTTRIFQLSNLSDFINSIGLMSAAKRTTMPVPMENSPAVLQD